MEIESTEKSGTMSITWASKKELVLVIILSALAGMMIKLPTWLNWYEDIFFRRNFTFFFLPGMSIYFGIKNKFSRLQLSYLIGSAILSAIYLNAIPGNDSNDAFIMSCIHMVILWFFILGISYVGSLNKFLDKRVAFIKYLGELAIIGGIMMAAIGVLSGMTIALFSVIELHIEEFYFKNIAIWGMVAVPFIGSSLLYHNPNLLANIPSFIARIFSPLVLIMLSIYLIAILYTGKDPYNDREFLMIFNLLLLGVMALIVFSTGFNYQRMPRFQSLVLFLLAGITLLICGIALSAILFRIVEWGITANRIAVLGSNMLILVHLLLVFKSLYGYHFQKNENNSLVQSIAIYLPVYLVWLIFVSFFFPLLF